TQGRVESDRHRPGLRRRGQARHLELPLGAQPGLALAGPPQPSPSAAARRRTHPLHAHRRRARTPRAEGDLRARLLRRARARPPALLHRALERHQRPLVATSFTLTAVASEVQIDVGGVPIGGGAPVAVQSMTLTKTHDVQATTAQIAALASAGCELVRVAVPKTEDAEALPLIVRLSPVPVIADIHFNASLALKAIDAGVAAVRINPGNIGGPAKVEQVVRAAKRAGIPMRIGANSGSLPKHLAELAQEDQAEALVAAALAQAEVLERRASRATPSTSRLPSSGARSTVRARRATPTSASPAAETSASSTRTGAY